MRECSLARDDGLLIKPEPRKPWVRVAIAAGVLAVVAALVQSQGFDLQLLVLVGVVFTVGQMLESYVLTPRIVGDKIGLHPMAVIFAIMAGGQLFGFLGMLLALPVAAVANVLLRYAQDRYRHSRLYAGDAAAIAPEPAADVRAEPAAVVSAEPPADGREPPAT